MLPRIEAKLERHEDIGVLADLTGVDDIAGGAIVRDFRYGLGKLGQAHRFRRAAVVSDRQWMAATAMADRLFPQVDARVFPEDEKDLAMRWVADIH